jgi:hypothetical protein
LRAFCTADAGVAAGGILDKQFEFPSENAALRVDLLDRELKADQLVLAVRGKGAGQRVVDPDLDAVGGARAPNEGTCNLRRAHDEARLQ